MKTCSNHYFPHTGHPVIITFQKILTINEMDEYFPRQGAVPSRGGNEGEFNSA